MIRALTPAARPKAPQGKAAGHPEVKAKQDALDLQQTVFNIELAQQAELERERDALEALQMSQMKNEDAILKKWIEMI